MKRAWLVVNGFLQSRKFSEIYNFFLQNAPKYDCEISVVPSDSLIEAVFDDFLRAEKPNFVIFWDKDVFLAKRLEQCGLRLFNSARAIEICDNKILTATALFGKVPMPPTIFSPKTFSKTSFSF